MARSRFTLDASNTGLRRCKAGAGMTTESSVRCTTLGTSRPSAPRPLASRDLGGERLQLLLPEAAELREPGVGLAQWCGLDRIEPAWAVHSHPRKPGLAQHLEVLRHRRLR